MLDRKKEETSGVDREPVSRGTESMANHRDLRCRVREGLGVKLGKGQNLTREDLGWQAESACHAKAGGAAESAGLGVLREEQSGSHLQFREGREVPVGRDAMRTEQRELTGEVFQELTYMALVCLEPGEGRSTGGERDQMFIELLPCTNQHEARSAAEVRATIATCTEFAAGEGNAPESVPTHDCKLGWL